MSSEERKKAIGCENSLFVTATNTDLSTNVWCNPAYSCVPNQNTGFTATDLDPVNMNKIILIGDYVERDINLVNLNTTGVLPEG